MTNTNKLSPRALRTLAGAGLSALAISASVHAGCNPDYAYTGDICMTAANFCPQGTAAANGQILNILSNQPLFSVLGPTYGGDGRTTFALPDLRGRAPVGTGTAPGLSTVQLGQRRGAEMVVQSARQLATHSHTAEFEPSQISPTQINASASKATRSTPQSGDTLAAANTGANSNVNIYGDGGATESLGGVTSGHVGGNVTVGVTGQSEPMNIINPQLGINFCVVLEGQYPPRQ